MTATRLQQAYHAAGCFSHPIKSNTPPSTHTHAHSAQEEVQLTFYCCLRFSASFRSQNLDTLWWVTFDAEL